MGPGTDAVAEPDQDAVAEPDRDGLAEPDQDAARFATWWEPVLAPSARRLLARIEAEPEDFLDVGAGTGGLLLAAAERWPGARILALDASAGMLSMGRHRVRAERPDHEAGRFAFHLADAASSSLTDASVDVVTAAFVLGLVDDRQAVLREIRRVLRPGGILGLVGWLADGPPLLADEVFEAVLDELGLTDPEPTGPACDPSPGAADYATLEEAVSELAAAGFEAIEARPDELSYAWTRADYLRFKEEFDELELFEALEAAERDQLRARLAERWAPLSEAAFELRAPLVSIVARRPTASP